jgi:hypothetical protein
MGTIAGKLKGVMRATTPDGLAKQVAVGPRSDILRHFALKQLRRTGCKLNDLHPALYFSLRVGNDLAVLGANDFGQRIETLFEDK